MPVVVPNLLSFLELCHGQSLRINLKKSLRPFTGGRAYVQFITHQSTEAEVFLVERIRLATVSS